LQIVNGYACQTCSDVALAKAGKDPAHPNAPPTKPGQTEKPGQTSSTGQNASANATGGTQAVGSNANSPSVILGGALAQANGSPSTSQPTQSAAATSYSGSLVNVSV
jgi:hypothetical protein